MFTVTLQLGKSKEEIEKSQGRWSGREVQNADSQKRYSCVAISWSIASSEKEILTECFSL